MSISNRHQMICGNVIPSYLGWLKNPVTEKNRISHIQSAEFDRFFATKFCLHFGMKDRLPLL
jgi:hypothetical protein